MVRVIFLFSVSLAVLGIHSAPAQPPPAKDRLEDSVDRALKFLRTMQDKDGAWHLYQGPKSHAATSLAVMAFLSAGHVPGEGPHGAAILKGIRWVLANQQPSGMLTGDAGYEMYQHGISTLML